MSTAVPIRSMFSPGTTVYVDQWAVNPLLDDAQQAVPEAVKLATISNGDAPSVYESGDLPPFTASGVDPAVLRLLPWRIRHAAALETNPATVLQWVEEYGHNDTIEMARPGQHDYIARFRDWLAGKWTNPSFGKADPAQQAAAEGDLYDAMFGAVEQVHATKIAAVNNAGDAFINARDWRTRTAPGQAAGRGRRW